MNDELGRRVRYLAKPRSEVKNKPVFKEIDGVQYLKNRARIAPFGYKKSEVHLGWLEPIPLEIEALKRARDFIKGRCKYEDVTTWLLKVTGRSISMMGLHKAVRRGY